ILRPFVRSGSGDEAPTSAPLRRGSRFPWWRPAMAWSEVADDGAGVGTGAIAEQAVAGQPVQAAAALDPLVSRAGPRIPEPVTTVAADEPRSAATAPSAPEAAPTSPRRRRPT